jgi:hypothetical protein
MVNLVCRRYGKEGNIWCSTTKIKRCNLNEKNIELEFRGWLKLK